MWISHCKEIRKLTFRAQALRRSESADTRPIYHRQSTDTPPTVNGRHIGRVSAAISTEISADSRSICRSSLGRYTSVDMSTDTSRSTYRPTVDRYVDRHIDRYSTDMSTDTSVDGRSICRPIYRSRGAQNTHDPIRHGLTPFSTSKREAVKTNARWNPVTLSSKQQQASWSISSQARERRKISPP